MKWWSRWFRPRQTHRDMVQVLEFPDSEITNEQIILPKPPETKEMGAVTGVFEIVGKEIQQATLAAKQARAAAERITETIGSPPEIEKKA